MKYKTINQVQKFLNGIPDINCGGCGIAALAMAQWLRKYKKEHELEFIYLRPSSEYYNERLNDYTYASASHVVLKYKGSLIDSGGKVNMFDWVEEDEQTISIKNILILKDNLNRARSWNQTFNRKKYLPMIEKELSIKLVGVKRVV